MKELKREFVKLIIVVKLNFSPHLREGRSRGGRELVLWEHRKKGVGFNTNHKLYLFIDKFGRQLLKNECH